MTGWMKRRNENGEEKIFLFGTTTEYDNIQKRNCPHEKALNFCYLVVFFFLFSQTI